MNLKRYQIDMSEPGISRIEELKEFMGSQTDKDVFDEALTLLDWAVAQVQSGRRIVSIDNKKQHRELDMTCLNNVQESVNFEIDGK